MATSEFIGLITCPICGNDSATVHQQKTGTKKGRLYFRCYQTVNGSAMRCGTIQSIGPTGQDFIKANMRPIGQNEPETVEPTPPEPAIPDEPTRPIAAPAPEPAPPTKRRSLLKVLFDDHGDH